MAVYSDSELRELLDGAGTPEGEERLSALMDTSPEIRARIERLSGVDQFASDFGAADSADASSSEDPAELREIIARVLTATPSISSVGEVPEFSQSVILDQLAPHEDESILGRLGHHDIEEVIAIGGMGVVFRGRDPELDRTVAIKMLSPSFALAEGAKERFHREAKAAAAIEHPNVIPIYSVERAEGSLPFLVMRHVDGESLGERLAAQGALPLAEFLHIAKGVASGLGAAHKAKLTHRDVKPSNIMLERDGSGVWLTDFGLARAATDPGVTRSNIFIGTPEFASPEQIQGHETDHRSDLFSFGSVLYLMTTGKPAFSGDDFASLVYQIVHTPHPPAAEANPDLPAWLAQLIDRLLAKNPEERFASADEVRNCLKNSSAHVPSSKGSWPWGKIAAVVCVLAAVLIVIFLASRPRTEDPSPKIAERHFTVLQGSETQQFGEFAAAVEAARSGDIIEIATSESLTIAETVEIPANKFLTIRAAVGHRPTLSSDRPSSILSSNSPLILEGLTFEQHASDHNKETAIVRSTATSLFVTNCRFLRAPTLPLAMPTQAGMSSPFIAVVDPTECQFTNCEVYSPDSSCIRVATKNSPTGSVRVENSVLMGMSAFTLLNEADHEVSVDLHRNISVGFSVFGLPTRSGEGSGHSIAAHHNILRGKHFWVLFPGVRAAEIVQVFNWNGRDNLYDIKDRFAIAVRGNIGSSRAKPRGLVWGIEEPGSIEIALGRTLNNPYPEIDDLRATKPANFLQVLDVENPENFGPDPETIGPGEALDSHRETAAYEEWLEKARAACVRQ